MFILVDKFCAVNQVDGRVDMIQIMICSVVLSFNSFGALLPIRVLSLVLLVTWGSTDIFPRGAQHNDHG